MYTYTRSRRVCTRQAAHLSAPVGTRAGAALAPPRASNCAQARPASPGRCFFCAPWVDVNPVAAGTGAAGAASASAGATATSADRSRCAGPVAAAVDVPGRRGQRQPTLPRARREVEAAQTSDALAYAAGWDASSARHVCGKTAHPWVGRWGSVSFCGAFFFTSAATRPLALCTRLCMPVHASRSLSLPLAHSLSSLTVLDYATL